MPSDEPFFFDVSGSFYFNASPPLLVIQATEQSLVATRHVNTKLYSFICQLKSNKCLINFSF